VRFDRSIFGLVQAFSLIWQRFDVGKQSTPQSVASK
jgi:hypothetical protein